MFVDTRLIPKIIVPHFLLYIGSWISWKGSPRTAAFQSSHNGLQLLDHFGPYDILFDRQSSMNLQSADPLPSFKLVERESWTPSGQFAWRNGSAIRQTSRGPTGIELPREALLGNLTPLSLKGQWASAWWAWNDQTLDELGSRSSALGVLERSSLVNEGWYEKGFMKR